MGPPPPSLFPNLEAFVLASSGVNDGGTPQVGGAIVQECSLRLTDPLTGEPCRLLRVHNVQGMRAFQGLEAEQLGGLRQLLEAVLPADLALEGLELSDWELDLCLEHLHSCPHLSSLQRLRLSNCKPHPNVGAVLQCLLEQAPHLTDVSLDSFMHGEPLPPVLANSTRLRRLQLSWEGANFVEHLPTGPYLAGLEQLLLLHNVVTQLPAALSAATNLRCLALPSHGDLELTEDTAGILLCLPHLTRLQFPASQVAPSLAARLLHTNPQLEIGQGV